MKREAFKYFTIFMVLLACHFSIACSDDNNNKPTEIGLVSDNPFLLGFEGGEQLIKFVCYHKWNISSDIPWISFNSPTEGSGNAIVKIYVEENESKEERTGTITIQSAGESTVIEVIQAKKSIKFKHPSILYTEEDLVSLRDIIKANSSASITSTYNKLMLRGNAALTYTPKPYIGQSPSEFINASYVPASYSRDLAMIYWITQDEKYAQKAVEIIKAWAVACKGISYNGDAGNAMFLARGMYPMVCAYDMLVDENIMDEETKAVIVDWFQILYDEGIKSIELWEENDYFNKQYFQNHTVAHNMGIMMLGFAIEDETMVQFALNSQANSRDIYEMIQGCIFMEGDDPCSREKAGSAPPATGEIYDRYRHDTGPIRGLQYAHLTLTLLTTTAKMCYNNGIDLFEYTAPTGENLRYSFEYYSDFYRLMDSCIKSGYYCGETERISKAGDSHGMYELGLRHYPDSEPIKQMINSGVFNRESEYMDLLGFTRFLSAEVDK